MTIIVDDSAQTGTLVEQVMEWVGTRVASRKLAPGARLPSVRDCATTMGVSKSTVVEAYDRLVAQGVIVPRRGSGFYVAGATRPLSLQALHSSADRAIDPLWLTRQALEAPPEALKPGSGWLPRSWMPDAAMQRGLRFLAREEPGHRAQYDEPLGFLPLRQHLARRLTERGTVIGEDEIILTDSASQALDLLFRFLLEPGDTVLLDDPCYFNFHALLRAHRVETVSVPFLTDGPDMAAFEAAIKTAKPRLYLTNAGPQNPTGAGLSPIKAHRLLKLIEANEMLIIEDDVFADLEATPSVRLAEFDGFERVIQIGSFSKTISGAIRCGYIAARADWIEPITDLKLAAYLGNGHLSAVLVHHLLLDGTYRRHLDQLRSKVADAMGLTIRRLGGLGLKPFVTPESGAFLWARLPDNIDSAAVARHALKQNVILAPGNVFSASRSAAPFMRFNVARCAEPQVYDVLAEAMREAARAPDRSAT